jgi:hypothetical protein
MKKTLWFFVIALLAVDIFMLLQRRQIEKSFQGLRRESASAMMKTQYAAEEETILTTTRVIPASFPRARSGGAADDRVQIFLIASVADCTNCIEDEVTELNEVVLKKPGRIAGIEGFFVDENRMEMAERFIKHLSPAPAFPISVRNVLSQLRGATTPLVLVVRARDGRILDAHKPIPEDLLKRDAFYARWTAALGLS